MSQNPRRVPPTLEAIDPLQEGAPRTINPIGSPVLHVGTTSVYQESQITMDRSERYHIPETNQVRTSRDGKSRMQFAAGQRVPLRVAYNYGLVDETGAVLARPKDEKPAVADNDAPIDFRSEGAAPENRAEPAPDNRKKKA